MPEINYNKLSFGVPIVVDVDIIEKKNDVKEFMLSFLYLSKIKYTFFVIVMSIYVVDNNAYFHAPALIIKYFPNL